MKILKKCREAIPSKEKGGKVIVIDIVINEKKEEHDITEAKLLFDLLMKKKDDCGYWEGKK